MLSVNMTEISGFHLTEKSWGVLKGEQNVQFRRDPRPSKWVREKKAGKARTQIVSDLENEGNRNLFEKLRSLRLEISKQLSVPPYVIFHDKTLKEMAVRRPDSRNQLLEIIGIGERKAEQFGEAFLEAIGKSEDRGQRAEVRGQRFERTERGK